jgi:transaldolase
MKIFIDTADVAEIREAHSMGMVDGVTTNPSLVAKTGRPFREVIEEIVSIVDGPISAEVVALESDEMIKEARTVSDIHPNIVVKIPMTTEGMKAVSVLEKEGIRCNVTLVFSPLQALLAAKAGAGYVSPFVGRLDDIGHNGMEIVEQILTTYLNYDFKTEDIVASVRTITHVLQSMLMGAHIATIPFKVIKQMSGHPLTDKGIDAFLADWDKAGGSLT